MLSYNLRIIPVIEAALKFSFSGACTSKIHGQLLKISAVLLTCRVISFFAFWAVIFEFSDFVFVYNIGKS